MQIVIDIPDGYVGAITSNQRMEGSAMDKLIRQAIIDGTPLPKGHGDLIDRDVAYAEFDDRCFSYEGKLLKYIPTVIPSDKK